MKNKEKKINDKDKLKITKITKQSTSKTSRDIRKMNKRALELIANR
ncbi:hypothetical protein [Falsibacillus albus]|nr:hypothetical protein [Falsibacillus albus]